MMKDLLYIVFFLCCQFSFTQVNSLTQVKFKSAKKMMSDSLYFKANEVFVGLLTTDKVLPDEICFYFGKNLFLTDYQEESRMFLYKYIALRDSSDQFFEETIELLKVLGEDMSFYDPVIEELADTLETVDRKDETKKSKKSSGTVCNVYEVFMCPVCNGTTVLVRTSSFGNSYQTCPYCDENGIMDCETYKMYLSGELYNR